MVKTVKSSAYSFAGAYLLAFEFIIFVVNSYLFKKIKVALLNNNALFCAL